MNDGATSPSAKKQTAAAGGPQGSFEETLKELEALLAKLERADVPLDDAITAYERGLALVRHAQHKLDSMDARLVELLADGSTRPVAGRLEDVGGNT